MAWSRRSRWPGLACLSLLIARSSADCVCSGLDYTNGGSYLIDGSSPRDFIFTSQFSGCDDDTIQPILVSPDGSQFTCSEIRAGEDGQQQSTW